jgi:hypothetical protein
MLGADTHVPINRGVLNAEVAFEGGNSTQWTGFDWEGLERALGERPEEPEPSEGATDIGDLLRLVWEEPGNLRLARQRFNFLAGVVIAKPGTTRGTIAFEKLIRWCCSRRSAPDTNFRRFVALSATLDPKLVGGKTYARLARELRVRKATTSAAARDFRAAFRFNFREFRQAAGRAHMRQARLAQKSADGKVIPRNTRATTTAKSLNRPGSRS